MQLFAGHISHVSSIVPWLRWLQYLSPIRYTLEILFRAEYRPEDFDPSNELNSYPVHAYDYDVGTGWCFGVMAFLSVGARVLAFIFLKVQTLNN